VAPKKTKSGPEPRPGEPVSDLLPDRPSLKSVREVAAGCKARDLYARGAQTVFDLRKIAAKL
jgi:hypothetical protein